jgi:hypothetical protein
LFAHFLSTIRAQLQVTATASTNGECSSSGECPPKTLKISSLLFLCSSLVFGCNSKLRYEDYPDVGLNCRCVLVGWPSSAGYHLSYLFGFPVAFVVGMASLEVPLDGCIVKYATLPRVWCGRPSAWLQLLSGFLDYLLFSWSIHTCRLPNTNTYSTPISSTRQNPLASCVFVSALKIVGFSWVQLCFIPFVCFCLLLLRFISHPNTPTLYTSELMIDLGVDCVTCYDAPLPPFRIPSFPDFHRRLLSSCFSSSSFPLPDLHVYFRFLFCIQISHVFFRSLMRLS